MQTDTLSASILSVRDLTLRLPSSGDRTFALNGMSFELAPREILCIVGESGSGKSLCAQALIGLLPSAIEVERGSAMFEGEEIVGAPAARLRALRGHRIGMIFQEPMSALNPSMTVREQIEEVFHAHGMLTPRERRARVVTLAEEVGLPDPARIVHAYPHQLSGGQRQRAMIAMALALEPALLIADEPTTALDVTTQAQILDLLREIQARRGMAVIFITHDFGVVADIADNVLVLRGCETVETGRADEVLSLPRHDYTRALIAAVPKGEVPDRAQAGDESVVCKVTELGKSFSTRSGMFGPRREVHAVHDVSFEIRRGETLGLVGESGSGKSTVARLIARILSPDRGTIHLCGTDFHDLSGAELRRQRRRVQTVFQDPFASLNPRRAVGLAIADGPIAQGTPRKQALAKARELLKLVGLDPAVIDRMPHEFSGGQRQRICIARALALEPDLVIADEAVSALDVTAQKQVLELLEDLRIRLDLSMLFITHDLNIAAEISDQIAVMKSGAIVELGPTRRTFTAPSNEYARELLAASAIGRKNRDSRGIH